MLLIGSVQLLRTWCGKIISNLEKLLNEVKGNGIYFPVSAHLIKEFVRVLYSSLIR